MVTVGLTSDDYNVTIVSVSMLIMIFVLLAVKVLELVNEVKVNISRIAR